MSNWTRESSRRPELPAPTSSAARRRPYCCRCVKVAAGAQVVDLLALGELDDDAARRDAVAHQARSSQAASKSLTSSVRGERFSVSSRSGPMARAPATTASMQARSSSTVRPEAAAAAKSWVVSGSGPRGSGRMRPSKPRMRPAAQVDDGLEDRPQQLAGDDLCDGVAGGVIVGSSGSWSRSDSKTSTVPRPWRLAQYRAASAWR